MPKPKKNRDPFRLDGKIVVITGGAGLLGRAHAEVVLSAGGTAVLADLREDAAKSAARDLSRRGRAFGFGCDITDGSSVRRLRDEVLGRLGAADVLINNAANNPQPPKGSGGAWSRFESFPVELFRRDLEVGLTGAMLCSQAFGAHMAGRGHGVILNIASDLGLIGPDQRIYRKNGLPDSEQPVKPVSYSAVKAGLLGLTRYCATYWADKGVRVNALCPGGVETDQSDDFKKKLTALIPMGRMAGRDEYKGTVLFMISDASSYMTGATVVADGGRTCW